MLGQLYVAGEGVETQADINWCKQDNLNTKLETAGQYQTLSMIYFNALMQKWANSVMARKLLKSDLHLILRSKTHCYHAGNIVDVET